MTNLPENLKLNAVSLFTSYRELSRKTLNPHHILEHTAMDACQNQPPGFGHAESGAVSSNFNR